jgi:AcrB/AcrD/AcrF family
MILIAFGVDEKPIDLSQLPDCKQYQLFNHRIGKLREYFAFPDFKAVFDDLYGMEPPALFASEVDAIYGSISVKSIPSTATITIDLPIGLVGGVISVALTGGIISVASLVGFVTLFGVTTRNGLLLVDNYNLKTS